MGIYFDPEAGEDGQGRTITTHSMLKTMLRCPNQAKYKYHLRLKPKILGKPLKRGTWMHFLLEEHHAGRDWRAKHAQLSAKFADLFDEEKDFYGDLPTECAMLMEAYVWHYKADPWKVLETEYTVETEFPDGTLYRGKVDGLVETSTGLWLIDHKTHANLPDHTFRLLDAQSALYIWAAKKMGLEIQGFIWNYLKTKAPSTPSLLKDGSRLSKKLGDTDYVTYTRELKKLKAERGYRITQADVLYSQMLKARRYQPGEPQTSPFFRRDILEKDDAMLKRVASAAYHTSSRMHSYPFHQDVIVERAVQNDCSRFCSYRDLCTTELIGGNTQFLLKQNYKVGDALDYYQDRAGEQKGIQ